VAGPSTSAFLVCNRPAQFRPAGFCVCFDLVHAIDATLRRGGLCGCSGHDCEASFSRRREICAAPWRMNSEARSWRRSRKI